MRASEETDPASLQLNARSTCRPSNVDGTAVKVAADVVEAAVEVAGIRHFVSRTGVMPVVRRNTLVEIAGGQPVAREKILRQHRAEH